MKFMQMLIQFMYHGDNTWDQEKKSISILLSICINLYMYIFFIKDGLSLKNFQSVSTNLCLYKSIFICVCFLENN